MKNTKLTEYLRQKVEPIWRDIKQHECVRKIGEGTIDPEQYKYFLIQDYLYLEEYGKALAYTALKATSSDITMALFGRTVTTLQEEKDFIRKEARCAGIEDGKIQSAIKGPTIQAYTDFMVRTAALGTFGEAIATLLVCNWNFFEIGQHLRQNSPPVNSPCYRWVQMYTAESLDESVSWYKNTLDNLSSDLSSRDCHLIKSAFVTASRYEYRLWHAVSCLEGWDNHEDT